MKNRKQLLADFYLDLLALPDKNERLKGLEAVVCNVLAFELECSPIDLKQIFERMAAEDKR